MEHSNVTNPGSFKPLFANWIKAILKIAGMVLISGMVIYGCSDTSTGTNDDDNGGNGGNGGGDPQPTYTNVSQILNGNCGGSGCHINQRTSGVQLDSYSNVTNSVGDQYGEEIVQPGDAAGSPIVDKIESNPEFGERMPLNGSPLSTEEISLIRDWIDAGAENN